MRLKTCKAELCQILTKRIFCSKNCYYDFRRIPRCCGNPECDVKLKKSTGSKYCSSNCRYVTNSRTPSIKKPRCIYCQKKFYTPYKTQYECNKCKNK